jgi:L-ascorbate metabolism protein UlaG (beta-lactamase superfamily)
MKVKWLGHSAFLLTASDGTRIITDPYKPGCFGGALAYGPIHEAADFVTVSHDHLDHNGVDELPDSPRAIRSGASRSAGAVKVTGYDTFHDSSRGSKRGRNVVFVFEDAGLRLAHSGDLGHVPTEQAGKIGKVDVLLLPVGGYFTIDAGEAHQTAGLLGARVIIPMHFKTGKTSMPITDVEEFTRGRTNVRRIGASEVEITRDRLPASPEIWILEHAL